MGIEDAFLQDILAHPDEDAPRLIYADWLDEHNRPRGEFIRVQCALARLSDEDPHRWPLEQREQELLREHEAEWLSPSMGQTRCVFRRGFVEEAALFLRDYPDVAEALFEQSPIRHICLLERYFPSSVAQSERDWLGIGLRHVAHSPYLARLKGLTLEFALNGDDVQCLSESPYLDHLTDLKLGIRDLEADALAAWEKVILRPTLRSLDLSGNPLSSSCLRVLARTSRLANLRRLNLACTSLTIGDLSLLAHTSSLTGLTELNLNGNRLTHEAATVLAQGRLLAQLEALHLDSNLLGDAGALRVREWPALPCLLRLNLGHNQIFPVGAQALAEAPALREVIALDLFGNIACDDGAVDLAASAWPRLQALNLRFNGVGDRGTRALARSAAFSQLTRLNLTANRITGDGARALIASPGLPRLARLDLQRNDIAAAEFQRLRERFGPFVYG
jgi:uncharacterized protein (TIGR02996 family)